MAEEEVEIMEGEPCPFCHTANLTLMERVLDIPFFGITHLFSMECQNCEYQMADLETEEQRKPTKSSLEISKEEDMKIRVIKSANATIKIPRMVEIKPGPDSHGVVTNVEGILNRFKEILEQLKQDDDKTVAKKAKNQLKKLQKVMWGQETIKMTIEDPSGNSAFISDKGEITG